LVSALIYKGVLRQCKGNSSRVWFERSVELNRSVVALKDRDRTQYCIPAGIHRKTLDEWRHLSTSCHYLEPISNRNQLCSPRMNGNSENVIIWKPGSYINLFMFIILVYSSFCENIIWSPTRRKSRRFVFKI